MSMMQLPLFTSSDDHEPQEVTLERKSYIQPFECLLANAELRGLLGHNGDNHLFDALAGPYIQVARDTDTSVLVKRLAYWEKVICEGVATIPRQVLFELSDDTDIDISALLEGNIPETELPKRRKLRYGPHDLHEYRGKFFPQLVKSLINAASLSEGSLVLDPFCGSGTTDCEARAMGMRSVGVDLNPLSVLVAETKTALLDLTFDALVSAIEVVDGQLQREASGQSVNPWSDDDYAYLKRWFAPQALDDVAWLLHVIDKQPQPVIKQFLQVSLSNIIRAVSWQKDADLRVRKEVTDYTPGTAIQLFKDEIYQQSMRVGRYLKLLEAEQPFSTFEIVGGDARKVDTLLGNYRGECDVLITSPPYATALPYIDTDRLSLVALNLLPRSEHRDREFEMIGNREVLETQRLQLWEAYQQRRSELPASVCELIDGLAETNHSDSVGFRKRNLPALLSKYFLDMCDAMAAARRMMRPGSFAFYVVGNNSTRIGDERLEIPTDRFLWEIGERAGWHQEKFIDMELLPSRDIFRNNRGTSESILAFRSTVRRTAIYGELGEAGETSVSGEWDFHDADTQEHLHAIHPYPARFIPQIPKKAILEYSRPGDRVLDPFCGSGTTLLESILLGRPAIGVDNNAVAHLVSTAKVAPYTREHLQTLGRFLLELPTCRGEIEVAPHHIPEYENRDYWFSRDALLDLGLLRQKISGLEEPLRMLALAILSALVVRASFQDSDTRYARVQKEYIADSVLRWYRQRLVTVIQAVRELLDVPKAQAQVHLADGRNLSFIEDGSINLIVTSPPYLNAYDYHKYHRHRLHWIDGNVPFARDQEIGKHDTFTRPKALPGPYFEDMARCFSEWQRVLKPNASVVILIGDAIVSGAAVPVADRYIEILETLGITLEHRWLRNLQTTRKSFNQNARIQQEHVLLLKKSSEKK